MGIKLCVTNKYFIMFFFLAVFLSFYEAVTGTCNAYYAQYILGNRDLLGALASFESIPQIVTVLVLSPFIAKFGKRNVALIGAIVVFFIPGVICPLCMMKTMRCHTVFQPFVRIMSVLVAGGGVAALVHTLKKDRASQA